MKKIILFVATIFLLSFSFLFSQDKEPTPLRMKIKLNGIIQDTTISEKLFPQEHIIKTWQWGGFVKWTEGLKMNAMQGWNLYGFFSGEKNYTPSPSKRLNAIIIDDCPLDTESFQYEQTLLITKPEDFVPRPNDPTNAVFGLFFLCSKIFEYNKENH
jgi:hypothetical protein